MDRSDIDSMLRQFANIVLTESDIEHRLIGRTSIMGIEFLVTSFGIDSTICRSGVWLVGLYGSRPYHVIFGEDRFEEDLWLLRLIS